jgi:CHAT domain-containing protein/tetratricopeptide (TPR) repeat protein
MPASVFYRLRARIFVGVLTCLFSPLIAGSQQSPPRRYSPPELQATDQDVRDLLSSAESKSLSGEFEKAFADSKEALELAEKKGLVKDRAIAEESVASGYFAIGKIDESLKLYQASLEHAEVSSNLVLQADALVALSALPQLQENLTGALELLEKAQTLAERSRNPYIRTRVLGERGRILIASGHVEEGRKLVEEALNIDRVNGYNFEALHSVYEAYAFLSQPQPDFAKAISQLESARDLAIEKDQYFAFVQAQNALGAIYIHDGSPQKGIATLEATLNGTLLKNDQTVQMPEAFHQAANLPFMKATMLEALAIGYEAAHAPDKAFQTWNELYLLSSETGFDLTLAESASKMAMIDLNKKQFPDALKYFGIAAHSWRILQNTKQLSLNLTGEALLLIQLERGEESIPLETEVADVSEKTHDRKALFTAYGILAEIYQPLDKFQESRSVLEKAIALIKPGPTDSEIDPKAIVEDYIRLGNDYRAFQLPVKELVTLEKEVDLLHALKDTESLQKAITYLKGRLETLKAEEMATTTLQDGRLIDSLWYSEILYVWSGVPVDAVKDENWNRLFSLPFQIAHQPNGPQAMDEMLGEMDSMLGIAKLPILESLSEHFLTSDLKPTLAERYASEAETVARQAPNPSDALITTPVCQLAVAYANEGKADTAKQKLDECMALAEKANDAQSRVQANTANTFVHLWTNDLGAAEDSLKFLLANDPQNFYFQLDLAIALVKKDQYEKGAEEFNRAIKVIEDKKDLNAEAAAFDQMASALGSALSEHRDQQLEKLKSAEAKSKQTINLNGTAAVVIEIGTYYLTGGDNKAALEYFEQAETLGQEAHDSQISARAALLGGNAYNSLGDYRNAEKLHRRAATTYHEIGDSNLEAMSVLFAAEDLQSSKNFDSALSVALEADTIASRSSTPITRFWIQNTLEPLYYRAGEFDRALQAAQQAERFASEAGDRQQSGRAYIALASICEILGQWEDAETAANKALQIFDSLKNSQGKAVAYIELAAIYGDRSSSLINFDKAMWAYSEATKLGNNLQSELVEIYSQTGRLSEAIAAAKSAVQDCIRNNDTECEASALSDLAEVERKDGDLRGSASSLKEAKRLGAGIKDVYFQGSLLYREAGQLRADGKLEQALKAYEQLVSLVERVKDQGDMKSQRSLSETYGYIYDDLSSTLYALSAGKSGPLKTRLASLALQYTEDNKAREFARTWGRTFVAELRRTLPSDVQEKERSLLSERDHLLADSKDGEPKPKVDSIKNEIEAFNKNLRLTHPQYAAIAYPQPVTLVDIPLRKDETLVELKITDESTLVWIARKLTGDRVDLLDFYEVTKPRRWFEERVSKLRTALNGARPDQINWQISEELFKTLFPISASKVLLESKNIVFIPDDVLSVIPFELLSPVASKGQFPLLSLPTTYYPSAAALRLARTAGHVTNWQEAFLGIGDPITSPEDVRYDLAGVLSSNRGTPSESAPSVASSDLDAANLERIKSRGLSFERLPGTAKELQDIVALFKDRGQTAETRLGADATKDRLADTDLTRFRFLHFATHGILPIDSNIKEPALVLSYDGSVQAHMLLSMSEILGMKINSETVVLSACNTGSGTVSRAEGVMSLGRAFMAAGAESVTVSLWQVSDVSTQILMEQYYRNILDGKSKGEALAEARTYLFKNGFSNPFFWGPFVLIGD